MPLRISPNEVVITREEGFASGFARIWPDAQEAVYVAQADPFLSREPAVICIQRSIAVLEAPCPRRGWWIF